MTAIAEPPPAAAKRADTPLVSLALDTTWKSMLHRVARVQTEEPVSIARIYAITVLVTFVPLVIAAMMGSLPLVTIGDGLRLPFLRDWNVFFMFLVSFPTLVALTLTDQAALATALKRIQADGIVTPAEEETRQLVKRWKHRFARINIFAYLAGGLCGLIVAVFNYRYYTPKALGFWMAREGKLQPDGYVFLYCIFVFYGVAAIYLVRSIATSVFLRNIVRSRDLHMLPAHPDGCGGLRPIGHLGLRNQYVLSVVGLNVVVLAMVQKIYLPPDPALHKLLVATALAYIVAGPIVFMGPLLSFRSGMLRTKSRLMGDVAQRLRVELDRVQTQIPAPGVITKDDEELINRLRKIGTIIDELPVWPFDARTLRKFGITYILPIIAGVTLTLQKQLIETIAHAIWPK